MIMMSSSRKTTYTVVDIMRSAGWTAWKAKLSKVLVPISCCAARPPLGFHNIARLCRAWRRHFDKPMPLSTKARRLDVIGLKQPISFTTFRQRTPNLRQQIHSNNGLHNGKQEG